MRSSRRVLFICIILLATVLQPVLAINDYGEDGAYLGQVVDDYENDDNVASTYNVINNVTLDCMELNYTTVKEYENFTTYTEKDALNRLSQTDSRSTFTGILRTDNNILLYKDYEVGHFTDFEWEFEFYVDSLAQSSPSIWRMSLVTSSSHPEDQLWIDQNGGTSLGVVVTSPNIAGKYYLYLNEFDVGNLFFTSGDYNFDIDIKYYGTMNKTGTGANVYIYSDSARTIELEHITHTLANDRSYRYVLCPQSLDFAVGIYETTGYVEYLWLGNYTSGYEDGHYYTVEMLAGNRSLALLYNASISGGTGMTMEFSRDNVTWVDHNNAPGSDTLINGFESLDLRDPNFTALYTRVNMTSAGENTPRLYQFRLVTITGDNFTIYENVTGAWVDYNFTSIVTVVGDNVTGFLNSTYFKDGDFYSAYEVTGAPGYDIRFNVTGLPDNLICICLDLFMYYDGSGGHTFQIEVWNFTDSNWDFIDDIPDECCRWFNNTLECVPNDYVQNGTLMGRFYHPSPGNVNHVWGLDYGKLRVYVPYEVECEEVPATLAMGRYYALAIILLILGLLLGLGMRRKR